MTPPGDFRVADRLASATELKVQEYARLYSPSAKQHFAIWPPIAATGARGPLRYSIFRTETVGRSAAAIPPFLLRFVRFAGNPKTERKAKSMTPPPSLERAGPASRVYFSERLRLHYADWGNPEAPPLILIHGSRDHCRNWDWVAEGLRRDWHILAPDLRGHGDSAWSPGGHYAMAGYLYDLSQLIHQQELPPVRIIAHSLGGMIALRYAGLYPEKVERLIVIEGLGYSPKSLARQAELTIAQRMRRWIEEQRALSARLPRRYGSIEEALARMQEANRRLSPEQARHLTVHGVNQNEDGTYSWKFDNYVRSQLPYEMTESETLELWGAIFCPLLLVYGKESWASNPQQDGRLRHFRNAQLLTMEGAGHWVHHDRLDAFLEAARRFLNNLQK